MENNKKMMICIISVLMVLSAVPATVVGFTEDSNVNAAYIDAKIGDAEYPTLEDAFTAVSSSEIKTITLQRETTSGGFTIGVGVTLDLNGYKLTTSAAIDCRGTITDGSVDKGGVIENTVSSKVISLNGGAIENITIKGLLESSGIIVVSFDLYSGNGGSVKDCRIYCGGLTFGSGIYVNVPEADRTVSIENVSFFNVKNGVAAHVQGTGSDLTIKNCHFDNVARDVKLFTQNYAATPTVGGLGDTEAKIKIDSSEMDLILLKADSIESKFSIYSPVVNSIIVGYGTNTTEAEVKGQLIVESITVSSGASLTVDNGAFIEYSGTGSFDGSIAGNVYTVTYNSNGGTGSMSNAHFAYGESYTAASCAFTAPSGKVFDFWSTSAAGSEVSSIDSNVTLYAVWKDAPVSPPSPPSSPSSPSKPPAPAPESKPQSGTVDVKDGNTEGTVDTTVDKETGKVTKVETDLKDDTTGVETKAVKTDEGTEVKTTIPSSAVKTDEGTVAVIDDKVVKEALKQIELAEEKTGIEDSKPVVEIVVTGGDEAETTIEMPAESLKTVAETGADVSISSESGKIVLDSDAASTISEKTGNVSIMLGQATSEDLNEMQKAKAGDRKVIKIEASVGESLIHDLEGEAVISVPYELKDGEDPEKIVIYYLDNDGNMEEMETTYDAVTKEVSFKTTHFSYYMVAFKDSPSPSTFDMNIVYIVIGVLVALAIVAVLFYYRSRSV